MSDFASKNEMRQIARGYERLALLAFQRLAAAENSALDNSEPERA